ncbi:transposase [Moraxella caprae]|uniref:transposase n=1 Tax=Moraxella caprae TaxID=90240 RepID=UPI000E1BD3AA
MDETGIDTHARSLKGQRAYDKVSGRRYQRVSLVAGQIGGKAKNLIAPLIYNNTMTSALFETWFEQMLLPCLNNHTKQTGRSCIIILDNARFHRMKRLQELINNTTYTQQTTKSPHTPMFQNSSSRSSVIQPCLKDLA